jgi:hypothetical protein
MKNFDHIVNKARSPLADTMGTPAQFRRMVQQRDSLLLQGGPATQADDKKHGHGVSHLHRLVGNIYCRVDHTDSD